MSDDSDINDLREQTQSGDRMSEMDAPKNFADTVYDALGAADRGEIGKTLSFWDPRLAALLHALEQDDARRQQTATRLRAALSREDDDSEADRSEIIRLALRVGLREADPELLDDARDAHRRQQGDQF